MFASTVFYLNTNTIIKVKYKTITVHTECGSLCFLCLGKKSSFIPHNRYLWWQLLHQTQLMPASGVIKRATRWPKFRQSQAMLKWPAAFSLSLCKLQGGHWGLVACLMSRSLWIFLAAWIYQIFVDFTADRVSMDTSPWGMNFLTAVPINLFRALIPKFIYQEGDMGICSIDVFLMWWCGE